MAVYNLAALGLRCSSRRCAFASLRPSLPALGKLEGGPVLVGLWTFYPAPSYLRAAESSTWKWYNVR